MGRFRLMSVAARLWLAATIAGSRLMPICSLGDNASCANEAGPQDWRQATENDESDFGGKPQHEIMPLTVFMAGN